MNEALLGLVSWTWRWAWVPDLRSDERERQVWTEHIVDLFADWTSAGLAEARQAWPGDAETEFPVTSDMVGHGAAEILLERAGQLPASARLAWGAAFVGGQPRWAPVPVVVEFRMPQAEDPNYLMDAVGAAGRDTDARAPMVEYVTTPVGDGVRVFAMARSPMGAAFGRVEAAMRLDTPPSGGAASVSVDVVLTTTVFEMALMALIGPGVEQLMQQIATDCVPPEGEGPARIVLTPQEGPS
jgi:hypothetical protein